MFMVRKITSLLKSIIPERFKQYARELLHIPNMEGSLCIIRRNGFCPTTVIDVGAYTGDWTRMCKRLFPQAQVLMIEPQQHRRRELERVVNEYTGVSLIQALVGAIEQPSIGFYAMESASSVLSEAAKEQVPSCYYPMTTLDKLTAPTLFATANLIKLDVQGYELEVLRGGTRVLASAEVVVMEANLIAIYQDAPLFHDVVCFMAERDFCVYDICTFFRRPFDQALWQVDLIFVRSSSALLASRRWK